MFVLAFFSFGDALASVGSFAEAHPVLMTSIVWPFVLGFFTLALKPRSPETYAKIAKVSPRLAAFLQLVAALGIDPLKATKAVVKVVTGKVDEAKLPIVLVIATFALMGLGACTPKQQALAVDLLADNAKCALALQDLPNEEILRRCLVRPENAKRVIDLVSQSRAIGAKHAADAAALASAKSCPPTQ